MGPSPLPIESELLEAVGFTRKYALPRIVTEAAIGSVWIAAAEETASMSETPHLEPEQDKLAGLAALIRSGISVRQIERLLTLKQALSVDLPPGADEESIETPRLRYARWLYLGGTLRR